MTKTEAAETAALPPLTDAMTARDLAAHTNALAKGVTGLRADTIVRASEMSANAPFVVEG